MEVWKFFAGIAFFITGMNGLEHALDSFAGRRFKKFLLKTTSNRFLALINGIFTTAILQSSSLVILITIALAGAGLLPLKHCLGLVLGANIGTTFTGWWVEILGFNFKLDAAGLPMIAIGGLAALVFRSSAPMTGLGNFFRIIFSLGLIVVGLEYVKTSALHVISGTDWVVALLASEQKIVLVLFGFLLTALIQSSSAMMLIALSALHSGAISLPTAAWIIIGADFGTSMTGLIGSWGGGASRLRVGVAHFGFNLLGAILAAALLPTLLSIIPWLFPDMQETQMLVAFHTGFNLCGVLLFFPFLGYVDRLLMSKIGESKAMLAKYIQAAGTDLPVTALSALDKELGDLRGRVCSLIEKILKCEYVEKEYELIKDIESDVIGFALELRRQALETGETKQLDRQLFQLRKMVEAAKAVHDIAHNLREFQESVDEGLHRFPKLISNYYRPLLERFTRGESSEKLMQENSQTVSLCVQWIYRSADESPALLELVSEALNVNRELYLGVRLLIESDGNLPTQAVASSNVSN